MDKFIGYISQENLRPMSSFLYRERHIKPWLAFWWSHFISDEPNHPFHGNPNIFLEYFRFQSKTSERYQRDREKKSLIEFSKKQENLNFSKEVDKRTRLISWIFQQAAIICGKWGFWQIYAQWRLIVGDKCGFFATGHLWPSHPPSSPTVVHPWFPHVRPHGRDVLVLPEWSAESPPTGVRQPLPVGGLRPGKHSKF